MSVTAVPIPPVREGTLMRLWIGLAAAAAIAGVAAWATTEPIVARQGSPAQFLSWNAGQSGVVQTESGLQYQVIKAGEGDRPTDADVALINYVGKFRDGKVFDQAQRAPLPVSGVVPGFGEGLKLMQKGGKYRLWIKPELGYGDKEQGGGAIPANSLLIFEVELLDFIPQAVLQQMQLQQQMQQGGGMPPGVGGPPPAGR